MDNRARVTFKLSRDADIALHTMITQRMIMDTGKYTKSGLVEEAILRLFEEQNEKWIKWQIEQNEHRD